MKLKIYKNLYPGIHETQLKFEIAEIAGKLVTFFEETEEGYPYPRTGLFSYKKDNTYKHVFKKLNLNYVVTISVLDCWGDYYDELTGYVYLNFINRLRLAWIFEQHWLQKDKNVKWLIGIIVSSGVVVFGMQLIKKIF